MEDTLYSEKQIIKVVQLIKSRQQDEANRSADLKDLLINLTDKEKEDPELVEISKIASKYPNDDGDFINELMWCPDFEDLMEEG